MKPKHYIFIGLGVAALGAIIYFATRPKKDDQTGQEGITDEQYRKIREGKPVIRKPGAVQKVTAGK